MITIRAYDIIRKKRDKEVLSKAEINFFIKNSVNNIIPDYQIAAFLMAAFLNGMNDEETSNLTEAMTKSGDVLDLDLIDGIKVDKHSTGGVGDKTTLIVGPIVAACQVPFAKMSGRGLGHTGGTIDKLEAIEGFSTQINKQNFIKNIKDINICIAGQTGNMVPADKKFYALRDVTATINSIPLIASSIMSKKLASGADKIILDVKTGSGAFMQTIEDSLKLAKKMVEIGNSMGRETVAYITDMSEPLGNGVGNSIEMIEAINSLKGKGPKDLMELCIILSTQILKMSLNIDEKEARKRVLHSITENMALNKLKELIEKQGGNKEVIDDYTIFKQAKYKEEYFSSKSGYIKSITAKNVGIASMILGAGRVKKEDNIDFSAGIYFNKKSGDKIKKNEAIATLYTDKKEKINEAKNLIKEGVSYSNSKLEIKSIVKAKVHKDGVEFI